MVRATEKTEIEVVTRKERPKSFEFQALTKFSQRGSKIQTGGSARASRWVFSAVSAIQTTGARKIAEMSASATKLAAWRAPPRPTRWLFGRRHQCRAAGAPLMQG